MTRWTQADVDAIRNRKRLATVPSKPSKYRNVKTVVDNERFDSKREAHRWILLKAQERAGEIRNLKRQAPIPLCCPDPNLAGASIQVSEYVADFVYEDKDGIAHVVDAKGARTAVYQLKRKWLALQSGIVIEEV